MMAHRQPHLQQPIQFASMNLTYDFSKTNFIDEKQITLIPAHHKHKHIKYEPVLIEEYKPNILLWTANPCYSLLMVFRKYDWWSSWLNINYWKCQLPLDPSCTTMYYTTYECNANTSKCTTTEFYWTFLSQNDYIDAHDNTTTTKMHTK